MNSKTLSFILLILSIDICRMSCSSKHCNKYFENCEENKEDLVDPYAMFDPEIDVNEKKSEENKQEKAKVLMKQISADSNDSQCSCKELANCQKYGSSKQTVISQNEFLYLKRSVKKLASKFLSLGGEVSGSIHVDLTIKNSDITTMKLFIKNPSNKIQDLDNVLSEMINGAVVFKPEEYQSTNNVYVYLQYVGAVVVIVVCSVIWFIKPRLTLRSVISTVSVFVILLDIIWNWIYLVKKEYSDLYSEMDKKSLPDSCHPEKLTWGSYLSLWFSNDYSFSVQCKKYYESIHVSPELKVSPMKAVTETFKHIVLYPLQFLGEYIGLFYQRLFSQLSWFLMVPVSIIITLLMFLLLIMLFGYRIRFPFFLGGLEPASDSRRTRESDNNEKHLMLEILKGKYHLIKSDSIKSISIQSTSESENEHQRLCDSERSTVTITELEEEPSLSISKRNVLPKGLTSKSICEHKGLCEKSEEDSRKFIEDELENEASENKN
ncbi:chloride channel CLIC-like protein 1 [Centruroides sculpturatus]|nr:chloride channel CLIC-like protein 1 [Centruroides sculpturatus]